MCEVQLMRISQNSLHVISTFRIPMMAIRMAQIKAFRRNNGVRCVIVGVASFTYVKEATPTITQRTPMLRRKALIWVLMAIMGILKLEIAWRLF